MDAPKNLSPGLRWCDDHGGWDPAVGYRRCPGCCIRTATKNTPGFYALHPLDALIAINRYAMEAKP